MDPIISLKNVYKNYGSKPVLKGIDLAIYPGQVIGYIGPNGAGKSTTVKILCGLISDYEGEVIDRWYQPAAGSDRSKSEDRVCT